MHCAAEDGRLATKPQIYAFRYDGVAFAVEVDVGSVRRILVSAVVTAQGGE
jgi:hypothetical protein